MKIKRTIPDKSIEQKDGSLKRIQESAYGDKVTICSNTGCKMRKKSGCFGFEGCPGFRER